MILEQLVITQKKAFETAKRRYAQRGKPLLSYLKSGRAWAHDGLNDQAFDVNEILNPIVYPISDDVRNRISQEKVTSHWDEKDGKQKRKTIMDKKFFKTLAVLSVTGFTCLAVANASAAVEEDHGSVAGKNADEPNKDIMYGPRNMGRANDVGKNSGETAKQLESSEAQRREELIKEGKRLEEQHEEKGDSNYGNEDF